MVCDRPDRPVGDVAGHRLGGEERAPGLPELRGVQRGRGKSHTGSLAHRRHGIARRSW